jgi:hypothetical protein
MMNLEEDEVMVVVMKVDKDSEVIPSSFPCHYQFYMGLYPYQILAMDRALLHQRSFCTMSLLYR